MAKRIGATTVAALLVMIIVIGILVLLIPPKDICADDVRGYERAASASLNVIRQNLSKIEATAGTAERLQVPAQLKGLSPTNFAALRACDTQCKLLGRCLRYVYLRAPSEACPTEYADYKTRVDSALKVLERLEEMAKKSEQVARGAESLGETREKIKQLESSALGSTGGRLAALKSEAEGLEERLREDLSYIDQQLSAL
ncbi:hypothetical protein FHP25_35940 [Vineibacter terrae]|uniref:Uncharacterized protein n=1 Tax=Vineibacter terrae TaxID=2586908 RepID=A0A5C8P9M4_9HYPH|nr:hypothetical protein [Vineibacter terrae]TXL70116.1 hypothetical protein FHP25_35940 [Vineibacter terrae]